MKIQVEHTMGDRRVIYPCLLKEKDDFERFFDQVASMGAEKKNGKKKAEDVVAGGGGGLSVSKKKLAGKFRDAVDVDTEDSSEVDTSRDLSRSSEGLGVSEEDIEKMSKLAIAHKKAPGAGAPSRQLYLVSN